MIESILIVEKSVAGDVEFLGELDSSFLTYADLSTALGVTQGNLNTTVQANKWLRFKLDGKEIITSKVAVRNRISWDHLYSKGLVYGTDDNGLSPTGTPTNQLKTVSIGGKLYKVKLLKGADEGNDPFINTTGYDSVGSQQSEWSRLYYPIITDDPNQKSYTGPMLASYTQADLQMKWVGEATTPGSYSWCQETHPNNNTSRVIRGYNAVSFLSLGTSSGVDAIIGWRPRLELVTD